MPNHDWFLTLSEEIGHALNALYLPSLQTYIEAQGLEGMDLWIAQSALSAEPEPMTAVIIHERAPYMNESLVQERLAQSAARGVLTAVGPTGANAHAYTLTPKGRHFAQTVPTIVHRAFQTINCHIPPETTRLVDLLQNLVTASLEAPEPTPKAALHRSRFYEPGPQAHILERLRRALNDLTAFRDDAHLASWHLYEISGIAWEAFSHIDGRFTYGHPITTTAELVQKLTYRGCDEAAYQRALAHIITRGWLTEADGTYHLTDKGTHIRQTAENETNRLFYTPWTLDDAQLAELKGLMEIVNQALQPPPLTTLWQLIDNLRTAISRPYLPSLQNAIRAAHLPPLGLFLLMQGQVIAPQLLTVTHIHPIIPYSAHAAIQARLDALIQANLLTSDYHLTPQGHTTITNLTQLVRQEVSHIPAPTDLIQQTAVHLTPLLQNSLTATEPAHKPALSHAHFHAATPTDTPLFQLHRTIAQLAAFRDDAHVAAWSSLAICGCQWEAFSHIIGRNIWGEPITTAAQAATKFAFRGYDATTYTTALQDCVQRGWLVVDENGRYTPTPAGQTLWQKTETHTDELFYQPWHALTVPARFELHHLLTQLNQRIMNQEG
ncbi:MAG: hypothetical protein H6658_00715 [Ardenticatenaceae bacterium]|nr:hypothetical protein [Ardenticatenaceae bacterium]